jgi:hypothetical protein
VKRVLDLKVEMSCRRLDDLENVLPGWACCQCSTYNSYQRSRCKACGHPHCYGSEPGELLPVYGPDGEVRDHYDPRTRTIAKRSASPS